MGVPAGQAHDRGARLRVLHKPPSVIRKITISGRWIWRTADGLRRHQRWLILPVVSPTTVNVSVGDKLSVAGSTASTEGSMSGVSPAGGRQARAALHRAPTLLEGLRLAWRWLAGLRTAPKRMHRSWGEATCGIRLDVGSTEPLVVRHSAEN